MRSSPPGKAAAPTVRAYRAGDEAAINRGFERAFGAARPLAEWRWKFPPLDAAGRRCVWIAETGGETVAHVAAQPVPVQVDGARLVGGHVVDAYSIRRTGLARSGPFARTVNGLFAAHGGAGGLAFVYGFPGERHMQLGRRVLGYVEPRPVPYHEKVLAPAAAGAEPGPWSRLRRRLAGLRVEEGFRAAALDDLWRRAAGRYPVAAIRDGRRATVRFTGRPGVGYLHLTAWRRGRAAAWAVARIEGEALLWADLLWDGRSPGALAALEEALVRRAAAAGARRGELWLGRDPAAEAILISRGWRPHRHPQGLGLSAVSFLPDLDARGLVRRCYVTLGDSDLV